MYLWYKSLKVQSLKDNKTKLRIQNPEITRDKYITSDRVPLDLIQNDPWETNCIILAIPTFLSTISEFKDLSIKLEKNNIKFISADLRNYGWKGNSEKLLMGTILFDIYQLINAIKKYYPNSKIFLLGQGFGAQCAYYILKNYKNVDGIIIANPLSGTVGINFFDFTSFSFYSEVYRLKPKIQNFKIKKAIFKMEKMTNNTGYKREMKELWERKYNKGTNIRFVSQCRVLVEYFWKTIEKEEKNVFWVNSIEDQFDEEESENANINVLGNHLIFTDYVNDDVVMHTVNWLKSKC